MLNGMIAGVMVAHGYDQNNQMILSSQTLIDSGINFGISSEEGRGGQGNALIGRYYHTSNFGLTLTDQVWDIKYLSLNCGGAITAGADVMRSEEFVVTQANTITVTRDPVNFLVDSGLIGWYKLSHEPDSSYKKIDFIDKEAAVSNLPVGSVVCVRYPIHSYNARKFRVNTQFVPAIIRMELTGSIFRIGSSGVFDDTASKIGELIVKVPQFQFDGNIALNLSSTSIANVPLTGQALANYTGTCDGQAWYAEIIENPLSGGEFDDVSDLAVAGGKVKLKTGGTATLSVYKLYDDGTDYTKVRNSELTFTAETGKENIFTVTADGVITAGSEVGSGVIDIIATSKPSLATVAQVVVTA
jgi:hypothetical protein